MATNNDISSIAPFNGQAVNAYYDDCKKDSPGGLGIQPAIYVATARLSAKDGISVDQAADTVNNAYIAAADAGAGGVDWTSEWGIDDIDESAIHQVITALDQAGYRVEHD